MTIKEAISRGTFVIDGAMGTAVQSIDLDVEQDYIGRENCTDILPSTGDITTIENGTCYYLKSHNKFFVKEYQPRRMKRTWQVQISPDCKLLRIQFHDLFGIAGNPYMNCEGKYDNIYFLH
ncbi:MAG: hypothetical protein MK073_04265 [Phycisphaerales bacterium]|nr:hypothetical protein [Phycisphaerales bacterium]